MRKHIVWLILLSVLISCHKKQTEEKKPASAASAADTRVVLQIREAVFTVAQFQQSVQAQYADIAGGEASPQLLSRLFDMYVEQQEVLYRAAAENTNVSDREVDEYLRSMNISEAGIDRTRIQNELKMQKFLMQRVYNTAAVSDAEVREYYQSHIDEFRKSEEIFLHQIVVKDRDRAAQLRAELLNNPERFEELAVGESIAPEAANKGQMGVFQRGELPQKVEEVAFSLPQEGISPVVETSFGFHIFKVSKKKKPRLLNLDTVQEEIRKKLTAAKMSNAYNGFIARLGQELQVQVFPQNLPFPYTPSTTGDIPHER